MKRSRIPVWFFALATLVAAVASTVPAHASGFDTRAFVSGNAFHGRFLARRGFTYKSNSIGLIRDGLVLLFGDSNTVGLGDTSHMDNGLGWQGTFSSASMDWHYANSVTDPMTWIDVSRRDLQPYDSTPGNPAVGYELGLGRYLVQYHGFTAPVQMAKFAASGLKALNATPTSATPLTPKRIIFQAEDYFDGERVETGKPVSIIIYGLGTNDASVTNAPLFAGNLAATEAEFRAHYGSRFLFAIIDINTNMTAAGTASDRNTIRAAAAAFVAAHPKNSILIDPSRIPVSNSNIHYVADELGSLGNMVGEFTSEKVKPGRSTDFSTGAAAQVQSINEATIRSPSATGNLTVRGPTREKAGDWDFLVIGQNPTASAPPALTTAAGFTAVANATGLDSSASGTHQYLSLYERHVTQAALDTYFAAHGEYRLDDPVITDNNTSKQAAIFSVRGAYQPGALASAVEAVTTSVNNASNTSTSAPGPTTLGHDRLIIHVQTGFSSSPNAASNWANASLTNVTVLRDSTDDTNETTLVATGTLATEGASGTWTGTRAANTIIANAVISIAPALLASETEYTTTLSDASDPITGGQNEVYTLSVNNTGSVTATTVSAAITLDASLTYVSSSGTGWSCSRSSQVVTCTRASMAPGVAPDITVTATTALASSTITTTSKVTSANASTVNASQSTTVQVAASQDATSLIYVPASPQEWANLGLTAPDFQWGAQDASSPLAAAIGGITLAQASTPSYQNTITGWSRKALGTADNTGQDWSSTNAGLPDVASNSILLYLIWKPPTANPAAARRIAAIGTSPATSMQFTAAGKVTFIGGANTATSTTDIHNSAPIALVLKYNRTGSETKGYTLTEKITVTFSGTGTGKSVIIGGSSAAAQQNFLYIAMWKGANAEMSDATVKAMLQTLGWTISWSMLFPFDSVRHPANDNVVPHWVAQEHKEHAA